jgi:nitrite reductase/ring-hydroxylating ferredoxin subunit
MAFEPIARITDLKVNDCRVVDVVAADGQPRKLALYRLPDGWYATQNECVHRGGELGDGIVSSGRVVCPLHQWRFDVKTGGCELSPGTFIRTYPVRVEGDRVLVDLTGGTPARSALPPDDD